MVVAALFYQLCRAILWLRVAVNTLFYIKLSAFAGENVKK